MFTKFLESNECMKVLSWFINHPNGEYIASVVCMDCDNMNLGKFMAVISILEGVGFLDINEFVDDLTLSLNKDSDITKSLIQLKDVFDGFPSEDAVVSSAFDYLYSEEIRRAIDNEVLTQTVDWGEILKICESYPDIDLSDDFSKEVYNICKNLDDIGELENFIAYTRNEFNTEK